MEGGAGDEGGGPLEREHEDAGDEVDDLEDGNGSDSGVEGLGEKVPEDLRPKVALQCRSNLVCIKSLALPTLHKSLAWPSNIQVLAVRTMSRAQWFLMSLPIMSF